jgi:DNA-binding SARP family transcriptional activator
VLTTAAEANPDDERLTGQLMIALYRSGRQADAIEVYQRMRRRLAEELGVDPSPPLQRVYQHILTADAAATGPAPPAPQPSVADSLVGRDAELTLLRAAAAEARAGRGRLVLIGGEPGIGKPR